MTDQAHRTFSTTDLLSSTFQHFGDLVKSEIALAKAEIADRVATKAMGGVWMVMAGGVLLLAVAIALEAAIFAIAATGIALHWSCLIVAGAMLVLSLILFLIGRSSLNASLAPERSLRQLNRDVATAREQVQ
jgi:predicted phage tail protein